MNEMQRKVKAWEEFKSWGRQKPSGAYKVYIDALAAGTEPAAPATPAAADPMGYEPGAKLPRCVTAASVKTLAEEFRSLLADMRRRRQSPSIHN